MVYVWRILMHHYAYSLFFFFFLYVRISITHCRQASEKGSTLHDMVKKTTMGKLYAGASTSKAENIFGIFDKDSSGDLDMSEIVALVNAMAQSDTTSLVRTSHHPTGYLC